VLLGLAASIGALIAVLLISWGHCGGGSGEDCDVQVAVASLAVVPALLLVAAVLLLLSARASSTFVGTSLVVLALFVAMLPLAMLSIREWWSLIVFGALLSGLIGYIVVPYRGETREAIGPPSRDGAGLRPAPSPSPQEAFEELRFWLDEVKARTVDLHRELRNLGRR
jgi:cell division protein FtsW (lipid II flippase)